MTENTTDHRLQAEQSLTVFRRHIDALGDDLMAPVTVSLGLLVAQAQAHALLDVAAAIREATAHR